VLQAIPNNLLRHILMTFKQLEALFWIAQLGGFGPAAQKLHTSQSALSKRIHELETLFDTPLFDRSQRAAKLTEKGEEMFSIARRLLADRNAAIEQFRKPDVIERRVRIGITELGAMTWLHRLVELIQNNYPKVRMEPAVDVSAKLKDQVLAEDLDLAFIPSAVNDDRLQSQLIGEFSSAWMCKPGMLEPDRTYHLHELSAHRMLLQDHRSGAGAFYMKWMQSQGFDPSNILIANNLFAIIGLTVSGLGISHLPEQCLAPMIKNGSLMIIKTTPALPTMKYVAVYKNDNRSALLSAIIVLAQACCDFSKMFSLTDK